MHRIYEEIFKYHLQNNRQMLFIEGPRQVGKTTTSQSLKKVLYLNWDQFDTRNLVVRGQTHVAAALGLAKITESKPLIVFDELHKFSRWKLFLKGFYDQYADKCQIIVTGSSKLGVYKKGGDSLMGRYFPYRMHPLSVAELLSSDSPFEEIRLPRKIEDDIFKNLLTFGGYPEPFIKQSKAFWNRWKTLREEHLFKEDIRELTHIQEIGQMQILSRILIEQSGNLLTQFSLASKVNASIPTIKRWLEILGLFHHSFYLKPWSQNITRSLIKEPKGYLWDWSLIKDEGQRFENFVASHLLKFVHYWTDRGFGEYDLYFLRDKEKREVDFLVVKDHKPWFMVEAKLSQNQSLNKSLFYFQDKLQCPYAFQVVADMDYVERNCFEETKPVIVPSKTFLSQLI